MRKSNIGIDLDGVVCDLYPSVYPLLEEMYGIDIKNTEIEKLQGRWEDEFNLTQKQLTDLFVEAGNRGVYRDSSVYPLTRKSLVKISRQYNIFYVTVRDFYPGVKKDTFYWLDKNKLPYFRVVFTRSKYKVAQKENFQFFIDDSPDQCNRMAKTQVPTYLFKQPWNEGTQTDALVKIVTDWKEIEKILLVDVIEKG